MRKLLSDHFVSSASLPNEFEQHFLPMFSHPFVDSIESIIDIVKLGPKLMYAAVSSNLLDIEWKRLDSEVRLPRFHRVRTLDSDDLSSLLAVHVQVNVWRSNHRHYLSCKNCATVWKHLYWNREIWLQV